MRTLVIYHMDGSSQVIRPRQEDESRRRKDPVTGREEPSKNFCGDWYGLVQAITKGYYRKYEVI